ncbi:hypothetical protein K4A83_21210 [Spirulina subsalsa FACHB-351]|uniref:Uncharacterized protein n=1 Tax=Spirulina subsalsa FACHB-351 TaxID=234711 RepID=A0ABT3LB81_9CYAN|nr:hypothetical protein [Spirulina subsalsa]MCW6038768.1 hypothetical protein [Spirulina subsalsa FACHB-351]
MLHLAQVQKKSASDAVELKLLAEQTAEDIWIVGEPQVVTVGDEALANPLSDGLLVLVELSDNHQVLKLENAADWVMELVQKVSKSQSAAASWLSEAEAQIEQWRQELTLKSQEISIKLLEVETRREQIEDSLQKEKAELEKEKAELKANSGDSEQ